MRLIVAAFQDVPEETWGRSAGELEWDCWETVEHLADDMFCYALQLSAPNPPLDSYVPTLMTCQRDG
ncbi:hypothetical protein BLA24_03680, partial [Streptomyces cinnamoneus]